MEHTNKKADRGGRSNGTAGRLRSTRPATNSNSKHASDSRNRPKHRELAGEVVQAGLESPDRTLRAHLKGGWRISSH